MLEAMRSLAVDFLYQKIGGGNAPSDLETWFKEARTGNSEEIFPYLVEDIEKVERVYIIYPDTVVKDLAHLEVRDLTREIAYKLPFKQRREKAIGPVIKRTAKGKGLIGPEATTQKLTLEYFLRIANASLPWSEYFREISSILSRPRINILGQQTIGTGEGKQYPNIYAAAVAVIPENKGTVFLAIADNEAQLPGERQDYKSYLDSELAKLKYCKQSNPRSQVEGNCPLCGEQGVPLYSKAVTGAGLNISNEDRVGAFPGVNALNAWKSFALCIDCADLLYVYKHHVANNFIAYIAGEKALLLPYTGLDAKLRQRFLKHIEEKYLPAVEKGITQREEALIQIIAQEPAVTNLTIIWAKFGQNIEDIRGVITEILPSRLGHISKLNLEANGWRHPIFPQYPVTKFDLSMSCLLPLFKRPGGKKAKHVNASNRLFQLKRALVAVLYKAKNMAEGHFWQEIMMTGKWHLVNIEEFDEPKLKAWYLLNEAEQAGRKEPYLTMAGWIRHLALLTYYFKRMGVFPMAESFYEPGLDSLKPYFGRESGIDSKEKAFAFLLGVLYGKVMQVQAARGVNVSANALTWLRRLTLTGKDLPELYVKVREKLLAYETEGKEAVRSVIGEVGQLGVALGSDVELNETNTCYFLLLGQSLMQTIIPSKEKK